MINGHIYPKARDYKDVFLRALICDLALAVLKFCIGLFGYTKLILMDGIFSFACALVLLFMWLADSLERREYDERYPYGYGKILFLVSSIAGLVVLIAAISMFYYAVNLMTWLEIHRSHSGAMMAAVISIAANECLYRYMMDEGRRHSNSVISWNAVNNRINVLISSLVLVFVVLASIGFSFTERMGVVIISLIMFLASLRMLFRSFSGIMDRIPAREVLDRISAYARKVKGVKDIPRVKARYIGTFLHIDLHISVNESLSLGEAHRIAHDVEKRLIDKIPFTKEANAIIV